MQHNTSFQIRSISGRRRIGDAHTTPKPFETHRTLRPGMPSHSRQHVNAASRKHANRAAWQSAVRQLHSAFNIKCKVQTNWTPLETAPNVFARLPSASCCTVSSASWDTAVRDKPPNLTMQCAYPQRVHRHTSRWCWAVSSTAMPLLILLEGVPRVLS